MSNDPHQTRWMHFHPLSHSGSHFPPPQLGFPTESTVASTLPAPSAPTSLSSSPPAAHANPGGSSTGLNPEGRVTKPARRRTRASRRTPTTVMNTDTTNFRAMVQQYTGGAPSATFGTGTGPNMLSFGFSHGQGQQAPASGIGHVQYSLPLYQQYNNLLSLNTNTINKSNTSQSNQGAIEGDRRIHFPLEGMGNGPRGSAVDGGYHRGVARRSSSSDDNGGNNNYIFG